MGWYQRRVHGDIHLAFEKKMGSCLCKPFSNKPPRYEQLEYERYSEDSLSDLEEPYYSEEDDTVPPPFRIGEMVLQRMWFWVDGEWLVTNDEGTVIITKNLENFWEEVRKEYGPHVNKVKLCKHPDVNGDRTDFYEITQPGRMTRNVYKVFQSSIIGVKMV